MVVLGAAVVGLLACGGDDDESQVTERSAPATQTSGETAPTSDSTTETTAPESTAVDSTVEPECRTGQSRPATGGRERCEDGEWVLPTTTTAAPTTTVPPTAPPTTLPPEPIVYEGSGTNVLDLGQTITEPMIVVASNDGDSNFIVYPLDEQLAEAPCSSTRSAPSSALTYST